MTTALRGRARTLALVIVMAVVATGSVAVGHRLGREAPPATLAAGAVPTLPVPTTTTTQPPPPPTTEAPATTEAPKPRPTTAPRPAPRALARITPVLAGSIDGFRGLGAWVDVFDWTNKYTNGKPTVGVAAVDRMADLGVQTLYIQAARQDSDDLILEPGLLHPMIDRAHKRGMAVIAWYLPTLEDPARDLTRLLAISGLNVEGIGVDIESRAVNDAAERSRRLVDLSVSLREQLPGRPIGAIVMPPVATDVINPAFWPGFPWAEIGPLYDLWMPMDYWSFRKPESGYRDAYRYTAENIDLLRRDLGQPNAAVHPIGGIADTTTPDDVAGYYKAASERASIGGGLYDYRTTGDNLWDGLRQFRIG